MAEMSIVTFAAIATATVGQNLSFRSLLPLLFTAIPQNNGSTEVLDPTSTGQSIVTSLHLVIQDPSGQVLETVHIAQIPTSNATEITNNAGFSSGWGSWTKGEKWAAVVCTIILLFLLSGITVLLVTITKERRRQQSIVKRKKEAESFLRDRGEMILKL
jgi:hypothetical protein